MQRVGNEVARKLPITLAPRCDGKWARVLVLSWTYNSKKIRPKQHRNIVIIIYKNLKDNVIKVKILGNTIVVLKSTLGKRDS